MKIISLNIWAGKLLDPLLNFIEQNKDVEIFCFQEVLDNPSEEETKSNPVDGSIYDIYPRLTSQLKRFNSIMAKPHASFGQRNAIFISNAIKVKDSGEILLCDQIPRDFHGKHFTAGSKMVWETLSIGEKNLTIGNIHGLWTPHGKEDIPERIHQSERILEFFREINNEIILCGDFNLDPNTESIRMLDSKFRDLIKENNIESTRNRFIPPNMTKFADYMFVSKRIKVKRFAVLDEEVSDHLPLLLEFEL